MISSFRLWLLCWVCPVAGLAADHGWTALGNVNFYGNGVLKVPLGELVLNSSHRLPVSLIFDTCPVDRGMGGGWHFPLLNSSLVEVEENAVGVTMPSGEYVVLRKGEGSVYLSKDQRMTLETDGAESVLQHGGWKFHYHRGLLSRFSTPDRAAFNVVRKDNRLHAVRSDQDNKNVLEAEWQDDLVQRVTVNGKELTLTYQEAPIYQKVLGLPQIVGMDKAVRGVTSSSGSKVEMEYVFPPDTAEPCGIKVKASSDEAGEQQELRWDRMTGHADYDNGQKISVEDNALSATTKKITAAAPGGRPLSVWNDPKTNRLFRQLPEGTQVIEYITTPGPAYGKVRQKSFLNDSGESALTHRYYYSARGRILRSVENGVESSFDEEGRLLTLRKNGSLVYDFSSKEDKKNPQTTATK